MDTAINVAKDLAAKAKVHPAAAGGGGGGHREPPPPARGGGESTGDERRGAGGFNSRGGGGHRHSSNVQRNPVGPPSGANGDRKNWGRRGGTKGGARSPPAVTEVC